MRGTFLAGLAVTAILVAGAAGPALADPPTNTTPRAKDVVGVGSDTSQYLFDQFGVDYDAPHHALPAAQLYSWDATGTSPISPKGAPCAAITTRPDGSIPGITQLPGQTLTTGTRWCVDYARSALPRAETSAPACSGTPSTGTCFVSVAGDAVTWASYGSAGTDAPATLTETQLKWIYVCKVTNWDLVGGRNATIHPWLPEQGSTDLATLWLRAIGITIPGGCVHTDVQPDEGDSSVFNNPAAIVPYSVADYIAQAEHSGTCTNGSTCGYPGAPACSPTPTNQFGCNVTGYLQLNQINARDPASPWPLTTTSTVNKGFLPAYQSPVSAVVHYRAAGDHIPTALLPFFGPGGAVCTDASAIADYGFRNLGTNPSTGCGSVH